MRAAFLLVALAGVSGLLAWVTHDDPSRFPWGGISVLAGIAGIGLALWRRMGRVGSTDKTAILDGSNILYWAGDGPDITSLRRVVAAVRKAGYKPVVWCDANAGYLIENRYAGPARLSKLLGMPAQDISVVPKGEPADPHIIADAKRRGALIVTNDRYRDWEGQGDLSKRLVKGQITPNGLVLHWPQARRVPVRVPRKAVPRKTGR